MSAGQDTGPTRVATGKCVGILGAGQLGCLLAESLVRYGASFRFYDATADAPGFAMGPGICASWEDKEALKSFFQQCDVVTYEFENVGTGLLEDLIQTTGVPLFPSAKVLMTTQNRITEKTFLRDNGIETCDFQPIYSPEDLYQFTARKGGRYILKTAFGGYDGKGQWVVNGPADVPDVVRDPSQLSGGRYIAEEIVSIASEISCLVVRSKHGQAWAFPLLENEHKDQILQRTYLPAAIAPASRERIVECAKTIAQALDVVGLLTVEFFVTTDGRILVNELAPRPHNSGHMTRAACVYSQFDALARVLLDLPLAAPSLRYEDRSYVMENLLGDRWFQCGKPAVNSVDPRKRLVIEHPTVDRAAIEPKRYIHLRQLNKTMAQIVQESPTVSDFVLYGKSAPQPQRKMGHMTVCGASRQEALQTCAALGHVWRAEMGQYTHLSQRVRLCLGVDPQAKDHQYASFVQAVRNHQEAIRRVSPLLVNKILKVNLAFFLAHGSRGIALLEEFIGEFKQEFSVILDGKFNEVAHSMAAYLEFVFGTLGAHGITINPFVGEKTIAQALEASARHVGSRGRVYVLCLTSESSTGDLAVFPNAWPQIVRACQQVRDQVYAGQETLSRCAGLVVGANRIQHLSNPKLLSSGLSLLCPGLGAQGTPYSRVLECAALPFDNEFTFPVSRSLFDGGAWDADTVSDAITRTQPYFSESNL